MASGVIALSCTRCGAPLRVGPKDEIIHCAYCHQPHRREATRGATGRDGATFLVVPIRALIGIGALLATTAAAGVFLTLRTPDAPRAQTTTSAPATASGPGNPTATYHAGQSVDVYYGSSWWPGTIKEVKAGGSYRIGYDGWSSSWDEDVNATRLRERQQAPAPTPAPTAQSGDPKATYRVGESVDILWGQRWWPGSVVSVSGERYHVHYEGWSSSHDETVDATRLRRR